MISAKAQWLGLIMMIRKSNTKDLRDGENFRFGGGERLVVGWFCFVLSFSNLGREKEMERYFCPGVQLENVIA